MANSPHAEPVAARRAGRPRLSESEGVAVRERLLDAATELAVEQGFEACALREIARAAEVSPGMIAYYFGDRQGLYEAMFARAFSRISEQVTALMSGPARSGNDRIAELIRIQVSSIAADPWLPKLFMREVLARNESPMTAFVGEITRAPMEMMLEWLIEEQTRHGLSTDYDPRMLALTIGSLCGFPFLMLPIVGQHLGLSLDDDFPTRLIEHNQKLLTNALRAHTEDE